MATSVASQLAKLRKEREALEKREKALQTRTHTRALEKIWPSPRMRVCRLLIFPRQWAVAKRNQPKSKLLAPLRRLGLVEKWLPNIKTLLMRHKHGQAVVNPLCGFRL